jgi:hypothetical protein
MGLPGLALSLLFVLGVLGELCGRSECCGRNEAATPDGGSVGRDGKRLTRLTRPNSRWVGTTAPGSWLYKNADYPRETDGRAAGLGDFGNTAIMSSSTRAPGVDSWLTQIVVLAGFQSPKYSFSTATIPS